MTLHRSYSFSVSISEKDGVHSSKRRKNLQSLFSTENRTGHTSIRTGTRNASNRFAAPLYRFWQKHRRTIEPVSETEYCITTGNPTRFRHRNPASCSRQAGLPACHETKGVGSLIPLSTVVEGKGVRWGSKLGHGGLSETTRKQYGKCKTGS